MFCLIALILINEMDASVSMRKSRLELEILVLSEMKSDRLFMLYMWCSGINCRSFPRRSPGSFGFPKSFEPFAHLSVESCYS